MKITRIEPMLIGIPYDHGGPKSADLTGAIRHTMDALYVKVETDEGITGWGEAFGFGGCALTHAAFERLVTPIALGKDAIDIEGTMADLHKRVVNLGRNGAAIFALSGIDVALWDIRGKIAGKPVHKLLNENSRASVPAYASLLRLNEPQYVSKVSEEALKRGYRDIKLHERTVDCVKAARDVLGPAPKLMVDTNCQWTPEMALEMAKAFEPFDLAWLEEPINPPDDYKALAALRRAQPIPIAAGENLGNYFDVRNIIDAKAVDVVQPDAIKMGGITQLWKAIEYAREAGVRVDPHSPLYGPGWIATVHVVAAMAQDALAEFYYADLEQSPLGEMIYPRNGFMHVPDGPGLGIEVDEKIIAKYRRM
jgi:D-galactarolactone cycloisomerase